jgi:gluconokinase
MQQTKHQLGRDPARPTPMTVILMGPSGSGKSTVGRALADALGWSFADADDLHAPESIDRMRQGIGLSDVERQPWLERVRRVIELHAEAGRNLVLACSALRAAYREYLTAAGADVRFVFLRGTPELLKTRLARRTGHFAAAGLLHSQLETLEPPAQALEVDAARPVAVLVEEITRSLRL